MYTYIFMLSFRDKEQIKNLKNRPTFIPKYSVCTIFMLRYRDTAHLYLNTGTQFIHT
jgi:hypothetical protein